MMTEGMIRGFARLDNGDGVSHSIHQHNNCLKNQVNFSQNTFIINNCLDFLLYLLSIHYGKRYKCFGCRM